MSIAISCQAIDEMGVAGHASHWTPYCPKTQTVFAKLDHLHGLSYLDTAVVGRRLMTNRQRAPVFNAMLCVF
jgi:hypothetical protein